MQQHLVGHLERVEHAGLLIRHREQAVVRNDDERVDLLLQALHTGVGLYGTTASLEAERAGDHTDGERVHAARHLGDDRGRTGAGAATLAGGDEHHVGALDHLFDLVAMRLGSIATHVGVATGTETAREVAPDVEFDVGITHQQRLGIGVDRDELNTLQPCVDHAVNGVDATTADADHLDDGEIVLRSAGHQMNLRGE
ncbi:unannotated protein [freshwater metagenome]|uniref:Unannotated protein n=1 Tax=freshwater metagenome TaxID=449393 RepID=A0A6J7K868_9ZZZZ